MTIVNTDDSGRRLAPTRTDLRFHARDITGTHDIEVTDIQRGTPSGAVAQSLAARMELPTNVPWSLRTIATGAWLRDDVAMDEQVKDDAEAQLTLTPKTHLGGAEGLGEPKEGPWRGRAIGQAAPATGPTWMYDTSHSSAARSCHLRAPCVCAPRR